MSSQGPAATHSHAVGNLPAEATSFVGRQHEIAEVERMLGAARLVTLTGVGGVGKSRLALRIATRHQRALSHGTWLVELATVRDPDLVAYTVAAALQIGEQSGRDPLAMLVDFLIDRNLLLVLDNCDTSWKPVPRCRVPSCVGPRGRGS
jgi:hypothetical protein